VVGKERSANGMADDAALREAAQWLARADLGTLDEAAFERWRAADPRHALAFIRVASAARQTAQAAGQNSSAGAASRGASVSRRSAIAAGLAALSLGGGGLLASRSYARTRASTPVGTTRGLDLPGAGVVTLNTDSAASWRRDGQGLRLWLERGEIALDLVERAVPVHVSGEQGGALLLPGRYNARLREGLLDLTILRGEARIDQPRLGSDAVVRGPHALLLAPGQTLVRDVSTQDLEALAAWRTGEILFVDQSLAGAVQEYNRHLVRKIVIADPALGGLRIGGRFVADDPRAFLRALQITQGVEVTSSGQTILLSQKQS
jgi:transmembrane sensor